MATLTEQRQSVHVKLDRDVLKRIDSFVPSYKRAEFIRNATTAVVNQLTKTLEGTSK